MNKAPKNNRINKLVLPKQVNPQDIKNIKIKLHNKYIKKSGFHKQCTINYNPTSKKRGISLQQPGNIQYKVYGQQNFMKYWHLSQQIKQLNQNKCVCKSNCHLHVNNQNNFSQNFQYNKSNAIYQLNKSSSQIKIPYQPKIYYQPVISHPICAICTQQHQFAKQTNLNLSNHKINLNNKPHFYDTKTPFLRNKQQKRSQSANCLFKIDDLKISLQRIQQKVNKVKELVNIHKNVISPSEQLISATYVNPQLYIDITRQQYLEKNNQKQLIRNSVKKQRDQQLAKTRMQTPQKKKQNNNYESYINPNKNIQNQRKQNQREQIFRTKLLGTKQAESRYQINSRSGNNITFSNEQIAGYDYQQHDRSDINPINNKRQRQGVGRLTNQRHY